MSEANKALARRFYEAFNQRNMSALDAFVAQDFVDHNPLPGQAPGLKGLKDAMEIFRGGFPDIRITNEDFIAEGDKVVVSSPQVPKPVAVRYGWADCPVVNLVCSPGSGENVLPASPFRTDDWPMITAPKQEAKK